ncbi:unnamed protein product [[Actinomadura] parvosata subsp. kistnae]|nr:unnamed protein product [Actinomadura parvosata subsp. kistnae]
MSYGEKAGEPCDACYHRSCDDPRNVSAGLLAPMTGGAAYAVQHVATTTPVLRP